MHGKKEVGELSWSAACILCVWNTLPEYAACTPSANPQAKSITVTSDGREKAAAAAQEAAASSGSAQVNAAEDSAAQDSAAEARAWIAAWRAKQGGSSAAAGGEEAVAAGAAEDVPPNVSEAREWIRSWRAAQLEKRLPADSVSKQ